jgi:Receptor family ligand binding region
MPVPANNSKHHQATIVLIVAPTMTVHRIRIAFLVLVWSYRRFQIQAQILKDGNICKIVSFLPFTDTRNAPTEVDVANAMYGYGTWPDAQALAKASYSLLATAHMAKQHFNARDTSIVPELGDPSLQYDQCNITLDDHIFLDSGYDRAYAVSKLRKLLEEEVMEGRSSDDAFCAVVGPVDALGEDGVSVFTEALQVPQLAYETINSKFSNRDEYPSLARVIPDAYDFGSTFPKFFNRDIWKRESVGVLYENTEYGKQFMVPIEDMAVTLGFEVYSQFFVPNIHDSIEGALEEILENGYRTIVLSTDKLASIEDVAHAAAELKMLGKGYVWMLTNEALQPAQLNSMRYPLGSPMDRLLRGAALFTNYDPFIYNGVSERFLSSWRTQNTSAVSELNQLQPLDSAGKPYFVANETYFSTEDPTVYASFLYDAVVSIGISACRMLTRNTNGANVSHIEQVFATAFTGASGYVKFRRENSVYKNSRDAANAMFGIYNIRPDMVDSKDMQR